jgi:hypothetical protein
VNGLEPPIPIFLFLSVAGVIVMRGPFGRALAERIARGSGREVSHDTVHALIGAVEELRDRVGELEERLDFTERVLARGQEPGSASQDTSGA